MDAFNGFKQLGYVRQPVFGAQLLLSPVREELAGGQVGSRAGEALMAFRAGTRQENSGRLDSAPGTTLARHAERRGFLQHIRSKAALQPFDAGITHLRAEAAAVGLRMSAADARYTDAVGAGAEPCGPLPDGMPRAACPMHADGQLTFSLHDGGYLVARSFTVLSGEATFRVWSSRPMLGPEQRPLVTIVDIVVKCGQTLVAPSDILNLYHHQVFVSAAQPAARLIAPFRGAAAQEEAM